jgi:hypothetical protein
LRLYFIANLERCTAFALSVNDSPSTAGVVVIDYDDFVGT